MFRCRPLRGNQLYRTGMAAVMLALLLAPAPLAAQRGPRVEAEKTVPSKKKPKERAPRGIAVVVWRADANGMAQPRLLPVTIFFEKRFLDASLYYAAPRPLALESGNYFEVQQAGQRIGYFTVENAQPPKDSGEQRWAGVGDWESAPPRPEFHKQVVAAETVREGAALIIPDVDEREQERELKRKEVTVYDEQGRPMSKEDAEKPEPVKKGDPEPLDRSPSVIVEKPKPKDTGPKKADDDPDRPHYGKKPEEQAKAPSVVTIAASKAEKQPEPEDPDRPILRHGAPAKRGGTESARGPMAGTQPVPTLVADRGGEPLPGGKLYHATAVSDAETVAASYDFEFKLGVEEATDLTAKMAALAQTEVEKYLAVFSPRAVNSKPAATLRKPMKKGTPRPPYFDEQAMRSFDLDLNNSAELVFTATKKSADSAPVFITLVARVSIEGAPRKLFASVTRADRMDAYPRLALVDAVDAQGDGRGELLFRRVRGAKEEDFILYRVDPDELTELFHGGGTE